VGRSPENPRVGKRFAEEARMNQRSLMRKPKAFPGKGVGAATFLPTASVGHQSDYCRIAQILLTVRQTFFPITQTACGMDSPPPGNE
jgi:hypothetical protein